MYISSWTETRNLNYICKTLDVINLLRSGWGFQYIEKDDFRADAITFPAFMRSRSHMSALS